MLRNLEVADYQPITRVADEWWGGRPVRGLLQRLFFEHFGPTSFIAELEGERIGFLIGFISQSHPEQAYIHFVGVHPQHRGSGLGRELYQHFFRTVSGRGCSEVRCITSPVNKGSIAFHIRMGFEVLPGDGWVEGVAVTLEHGGPGQPRVCFHRKLDRV